MNLISAYLEKLRTWGLKGAWDYLRGLGSQNQLIDIIEQNAKKYPLTPAAGLTIIGPLCEPTSLSKVLRDLIIKLNAANIPFQTYDTSATSSVIRSEIADLLTAPDEFKALKFQAIVGYFPPALLSSYVAIKKMQIVFWEFETGLLEYDNRLSRYQYLCGMSDFVVESIRNQIPVATKTQKILYPFLSPTFKLQNKNDIRNRYGLKPDDFVVFYNFSLNASYYRKNPEGTLCAFAQAFATTPNAKLLLKINGATDHPDKMLALRQLAASLGVADKIVTITDYLPTDCIYSITAASDCYISLHRGEGFGLGIAEAMSLGVPVILTDYSAPTEFCNLENSFPISYAMIPVPPSEIDNPTYRFVKLWADPSISEAAQALQKLYASPQLRNQLGSAAQKTIQAHFSTGNFTASIAELMR